MLLWGAHNGLSVNHLFQCTFNPLHIQAAITRNMSLLIIVQREASSFSLLLWIMKNKSSLF